ncbi:hypothetical protein ES705_44947 [subsurface metagenome]
MKRCLIADILKNRFLPEKDGGDITIFRHLQGHFEMAQTLPIPELGKGSYCLKKALDRL